MAANGQLVVLEKEYSSIKLIQTMEGVSDRKGT